MSEKPAHWNELTAEQSGFILTTGTQIHDGQEETIRAMVDFAKDCGVYKGQ